MNDVAIRVEGLGKQYRIGLAKEQYYTLRDAIVNTIKSPLRRFSRLSGKAGSDKEMFWALKDVCFDVKRGEVLGIIGRNGAGKSTLLKILSRITRPTSGRARVYGRVGSLLEVGTGFHPELTGRENIYLNGAVLGMRKWEIDSKFDEIVAFSGIEQFLDTPVKRYSSGMYVRLAFSVAAHLEPEILLVDEVLAVGDAEFQKKCLGKMEDVAHGGRTVLFVSHNMGAVKGLCRRCIILNQGELFLDGESDSVVSRYLETCFQGEMQLERHPEELLTVERVVLLNSNKEKTTDFLPGTDLTVEVHYFAHARIKRPIFWIGIYAPHGPCFAAQMSFDDHRPEYVEGKGKLSCTFKGIPLLPKTYNVRMGARTQDWATFLMQTKDVAVFNVTGRMKDFGLKGESAESVAWNSSSVVIPYEWELPDGSVFPVSYPRKENREGRK